MNGTAWLTARMALRLLIAIAVVMGLWWLYSTITAKPKAEARLGRNQAEAAQKSGSDAVNTVGAAGDREASIDAVTRSNEKVIRNAQGADAPVDPAARDAGLRSLCRRASYQRDPRCLQFTPAR